MRTFAHFLAPAAKTPRDEENLKSEARNPKQIRMAEKKKIQNKSNHGLTRINMDLATKTPRH